ncbi:MULTISPECIES: saccharopine dehydrogenase family protein [unclassified Sporosarcina]|uniref:saccharopine dehydrogenase family protein n=1 Tax=unclassified Sporosarcina TaxID=2647733 RepID=UPI00203B11E2|nr:MULTISPECIES: saccharopine dehydrogenase C-terminal domain-containing protein [unclassified Sporosarcina]GKV65148.1 saccharopine dehydrogenase [Sporosarcina sp. NCCP-2331]GLB55272.1 saccharopine dehydrogenase [Sporosarcina sp. NCCP-2378]
MRVVVLGAGLMGREVVRDLVKQDEVKKVYLADRAIRQAEDFAEELMSDKLDILLLDANNDVQLSDVIALGHIVVNALFYTFNERVAQCAVERGVHVVDLGGHIGGATEKVLALHEQAAAKGVTLIPDLGVAPGMINILAGYGVSKLDETNEIRLYVGGVPVKPEPPLDYNVVFSLEGLFDHYTDPSRVIRDRKVLELPSLTEVEPLEFERYGTMEAFHTSGGTSTMLESFSNVTTLEYKTIRYPGHAEKARLLAELGLLNRESSIYVDGKPLRVRDVMMAHLTPRLRLGDRSDAVLLRVIVSGEKDGSPKTVTFNLITEKDQTTNETAMARATANTISVVAQMIGNGVITKRGAWPPEQIVPGELYIEEMKKRGVVIEER